MQFYQIFSNYFLEFLAWLGSKVLAFEIGGFPLWIFVGIGVFVFLLEEVVL